jgi:hypothetical protein
LAAPAGKFVSTAPQTPLILSATRGTIEHMFERPGPAVVDPSWVDREPRPGEPGYAAYLAYEDQQIAFWNAYAASDAGLMGAGPAGARWDRNAARTDEGLLAAIGRQARAENAAAGAKLRAVADYANRRIARPLVGDDLEYARRSVEAEVALMLRLPPAAASNLLHLALSLARRLPRTFAAVQDGELSARSAELIADESANLDVAQCARLEDAVLPDAGARSYRSLRGKVRREVERLDADAVRKRAEKAREERTLYVRDEHDGMATLCLYVPAEVARAIYDAINDHTLAAQAATRDTGDGELLRAGLGLRPRDERRIGAQRADTIIDLLASVLGIDPWTPQAPATSSFLTEDQIAALDRHATTYAPSEAMKAAIHAPSEAMKAAIRARDKHCRFPGCRRPAKFCDLDHSIAFVKVGGRLVGPGTVYSNLGCLCRFHHQIKQLPGWHLEQDDRGRFTWTTPTGIRFITYPPGDEGEPPDFTRPTDADGEIPF